MNETNLTSLNNLTDLNNSLGSAGRWLDKVPFEETLSNFGNSITKISGWATKKIAEQGVNAGDTTAKIIALIILVIGILISLKITNKGLKWLLIIFLGVGISSVIFSF